MVVRTKTNIRNSPGVGYYVEIAPMCTFGVNCVTQNNSYVQMLAPLLVFLPLSRDLPQASTERFVKPEVVRDFCAAKMSSPLTLYCRNLTEQCNES